MSSCLDWSIKRRVVYHFFCSLDVIWRLQLKNMSRSYMFTWRGFMFSIQEADLRFNCWLCKRRNEQTGRKWVLPDGYSRLLAGWWSRRFMREGLYPSSAWESSRRASQQDSQAPPCCTGRRQGEQSTTCTAVSFPLVLSRPAEIIVQTFIRH